MQDLTKRYGALCSLPPIAYRREHEKFEEKKCFVIVFPPLRQNKGLSKEISFIIVDVLLFVLDFFFQEKRLEFYCPAGYLLNCRSTLSFLMLTFAAL